MLFLIPPEIKINGITYKKLTAFTSIDFESGLLESWINPGYTRSILYERKAECERGDDANLLHNITVTLAKEYAALLKKLARG